MTINKSIMNNKITITDSNDRTKLGEGRTTGMAFAFLKQVTFTKYEAVQALSPCKDYLNDIIAAENLNTPAVACGLKYTPQGLFKNDDPLCYIGIKIVTTNRSSVRYTEMEKDIIRLKTSYTKIQELLNEIEYRLGIEHLTTITPIEDDYYLISLSKKWISSTYMISLHTLLTRIGQYFNDGTTMLDRLNNMSPIDGSLWAGASPRLNQILKTKTLPIQTFEGPPGNYHGRGIMNMPL